MFSFAPMILAGALIMPADLPTELVIHGVSHPLYPSTTQRCPDVPSPMAIVDTGREYVVVRIHDGTFGLVDVTPDAQQLQINGDDFPALERTGLHDPVELSSIGTITGRTIEQIDELASPGVLSTEGFIASDETVISVLLGDNEIVAAMGLTHPELARPLWHVWNLMRTDLALDRWSMRHHQWRNMTAMKYNGRWINLDAHDTKGGQRSPFADGLEGGFWIVIDRALEDGEVAYLREHYPHCDPDRWNNLYGTLTRIWTGEMEPHYVQWYGFYEGHTAWRVDPVGIASVFGLRSLEELDAVFPRYLEDVVRDHHLPEGSR